MDKKRIIGLVLAVILVGAIGIKFYLDYKDKKPQEEEIVITEDEKAFKEAYESLNGTKNSSDKEYLSVTIPDKNLVTIKSDADIIDILNNGTGVVYFGFNSCPWCRSLVETLINTAKDNNIKNIYYVDVLDIRSSYEVKNKKLNQTKEGTEAYYEILDILEDYLSDYKITSDKKEYDTKEKRLYAPTVVALNNGEIVGFHEGTVESQTDPYLGLNDDEKKELTNIFTDMFKKVEDNSCDKETGC